MGRSASVPGRTGDRLGCPAAQARELVRRAGLRATAQRCAIAWLLTGPAPRHVTPDSLHQEAARARIPISLSSVYNIIRQFTDAGILRQRTFPGGTTIYDTDISDHQHMIVEDTGEIIDIGSPSATIGDLPQIPEGYVLDGVELVITVRRMS